MASASTSCVLCGECDKDTRVKCDACSKWRSLSGCCILVEGEWCCRMNADSRYASCEIPEEPEEEPPVEVVLPPGRFEVSKLLASRTRGGRKEYKVRWKGYDPSDDTWEAVGNIDPGCARPTPPSAACAEPNPTHLPAPPTPPRPACTRTRPAPRRASRPAGGVAEPPARRCVRHLRLHPAGPAHGAAFLSDRRRGAVAAPAAAAPAATRLRAHPDGQDVLAGNCRQRAAGV
eukprot:scaffold97780_cov62-Phaeocystis_antarctica.AAC.2